ncbi:MAG: MarP family serine protease [Acidimicrobiia bacterium]
MNSFDLALAVLLGLAAWGGWRLGLVRGVLGWAGFAVGLIFGVAFVDDVTNAFPSVTPQARFAIALVFLLLVVVIAQSLGIALGSAVTAVLPPVGGLRTADHVGGALVGGLAGAVVLWLLIPALASTPGWTARGVRGSWIAREVQAVAPDPPSSVVALGRLVGEAPFPEVFRRLTDPNAGDPPETGLDPAVAARVVPGVVRVEGQACDLVIDGSGFAATASIVVTNAHVVAGERSTQVYSEDGRRRDATVVAFDPARDLALLRVSGGGLTPLGLGDIGLDDTGAVVGHPGGGPLRAAPARVDRIVDARGTDIYRTSPTSREVLVLATRLQPGDSGAPLIDAEGRVAGVAFAIDPGDSTTGYALSRRELDAVLGPGLAATQPVDTGPCLRG